jgi:hypothetical protein
VIVDVDAMSGTPGGSLDKILGGREVPEDVACVVVLTKVGDSQMHQEMITRLGIRDLCAHLIVTAMQTAAAAGVGAEVIEATARLMRFNHAMDAMPGAVSRLEDLANGGQA